MANVVIVSSRLPVSVKKVDGRLEFHPSPGGVATGLSSYTKKRGSLWIGWPGLATDDLTEAEQRQITKELAKYHCYPVWLTKRQIDNYLNGYSNTILWPLFHGQPADLTHHDKFWRVYREVNGLFAASVLALSQPGGTIWVHDYQLCLLPELLRAERPHDDIGFFLHIPYPTAKLFDDLPSARSVHKGLLGGDLAGFHTSSYVEQFLESCERLNIGIVSPGQVILSDRTVLVADFPMGIDYVKFANASKQQATLTEVRKLRRKHGSRKIILTVDRLEPTKGLVQRLEAYRDFLRDYPRFRGKVVLIMLAVPSRTEIAAYQRLKRRVEKLVSEINAVYGTVAWTPVDYMFTSLPFEQLSALYAIADVAFITPLKDGMNLVAKEFVASQRGKGGVLILSQTAGAAEELANAIIVDPKKRSVLSQSLSRALTMPTSELQKRLKTMQKQVADNTVHTWVKSFMKTLNQPVTLGSPTRPLSGKHRQGLMASFAAAERRQLFLDYDGVLAEFADRPEDAKPTKELLKLLRDLTKDSRNDITIISGRSRQDLERWFGKLPLALAAEHGTFLKEPDKGWKRLVSTTTGWKRLLKPALEQYAAEAPGAFVEEKEFALVWHYRNASPYYAQKNLVILRQALKPSLKSHGLRAHGGKKILEIKPADVNKGLAVKHKAGKKPDFVLAIGDDYTDEDMFAALPDSCYSIKVGPGKTLANYRLKSVVEVYNLLNKIATRDL